jgi:DNA-binding CsgD family transcriptional regulator
MDSTPQQPDGGDRFEAVLREYHKRARQVDVHLKDYADYLQGNPAEATRHLLIIVPQQMDACRQEAVEKYGYDLERGEVPNLEETLKTAKDALKLTSLFTHYHTCRLVMEQWEWFVQIGLSGERLQLAVCQSVIEAYRQRPGVDAPLIEALEAAIPGFPQGFALSVYLTSHVATHTSLYKNQRLRAGIDELRTDGESRFSRLLKELPAEVFATYRGREAGWGDLMDVRTEAVRRLEKTKPTSEAHELAGFADREEKLRLLKRGREVGLPPREYELLKLLVEKPNLSSGEAGKALGITPGAVRALKSRIYKTLKVA